jgi:radial spoke head protein 4A
MNFSRLFTGNLNAEVDTNPTFPGKERHYLRAQLARIQHNCEICPKGQFEMDDETQE